MAVQWQWIPPVMLPWSEISFYPNYAGVDWIGSEFVSSKRGYCPHFQGSDGRITEVVSWDAPLPWSWCALARLLSGPVNLRFFMWGYLKGKVYVDKPRDIPQLKNAIETELRSIPRRMCEQEFTYFSLRLKECVKNEGRHLNDIIFPIFQCFELFVWYS